MSTGMWLPGCSSLIISAFVARRREWLSRQLFWEICSSSSIRLPNYCLLQGKVHSFSAPIWFSPLFTWPTPTYASSQIALPWGSISWPTDHRLANYPLPFAVSQHPVKSPVLWPQLQPIIIYMIICFMFAAPLDCKPSWTRDSIPLYRFCYLTNPEFLGTFQSVFTYWKWMNDTYMLADTNWDLLWQCWNAEQLVNMTRTPFFL